jgi:hypothetical protein
LFRLGMTSVHYPIQLLIKWCLTNFLLGLASNHDPPYLCLLSNWDYKCEPLASHSPS